ncbi:hypothetical protein IW261DRAFT_1596055 [Armillaria novae-zelandiae]|uniref:Uncharacterized protein n=1 Tax=Armillaria novae-zelandiae TaxID=153914 RepID=A0AA39U9C1_9AGAR|nr:hypothetical protein IW261DRAFT_1596055 [Armillaria novae-zelandiae]
MPPSPTPRKRRKGPGSSEVNSVSKASPRKRKFSSVDSSYHSEDADDAEEDKPAPSRRRKRGPRKGKQKPPTSEMKDFVSGSEESNGNEDYVSSATENDNLSDLADGAQPHQLRSGREYGPNKSRLKKETASKESPRPTSRDRESPGVIRSAISSANDSGSDEPNRLNILGSTSERTSSPDTQGISCRRPPELGPTHAYVPNSDQAASSSKRRRTAYYGVVSSSEDVIAVTQDTNSQNSVLLRLNLKGPLVDHDSSSRPAKAKRRETSSLDEPPASLLEKDGSFWFKGGSIVLISDQRTGFRVHRSAQAVPPDAKGDTQIDLGDSTIHFLHASYPRSLLLLRRDPNIPSNPYYTYLPNNLAQQDVIQHLSMVYPSEELADPEKHTDLILSSSELHSLRAIAIGREYDVPVIILPAAYYASTTELITNAKPDILAIILAGREKHRRCCVQRCVVLDLPGVAVDQPCVCCTSSGAIENVWGCDKGSCQVSRATGRNHPLPIPRCYTT